MWTYFKSRILSGRTLFRPMVTLYMAAMLCFLEGCSKCVSPNNSPVATPEPVVGVKPITISPTLTIAGDWAGEVVGRPHVSGIRIESNDFPCKGTLRVFNGQGQNTFYESNIDVELQQNNRLRVREHNQIEITMPVIWRHAAGKYVAAHAHTKQVVTRITFENGILHGNVVIPGEGLQAIVGTKSPLSVSHLRRQE